MTKLSILPILAIMAACNTGVSKTGSEPAPEALKQATAANWKGEIPCADCEGIAYLLQLQPNDSFYERSVYLGKPGDAFVDKGTWEMGADSLVTLKNVGGEIKYFAFKGDKLQMLDKEAQPITSPLARKYNLERTALATNTQPSEGLDFAGSGNEPFWSIEIDFGKNMHFKTPDGLDITVPAVKGERAMDAPVTRYYSISGQDTLTVQLFRQSCTNNMSGAVSDYRVTVDAKSRRFSGCGQFLGSYRLNALWQLEKIGNTAVNAQRRPTLELLLNEEKAYGYGGCNRFGGSVKLADNKLTFGAIMATEMACENLETESQYLQALNNKTLSFQLDGNSLYLGEGDHKLTFSKAQTDTSVKGNK